MLVSRGNILEAAFINMFMTSSPSLISVGFEYSACHELFLTSFIMLFTGLLKQSLVHWHQQCVERHVPKSTRCHETISKLVITGKARCLSF